MLDMVMHNCIDKAVVTILRQKRNTKKSQTPNSPKPLIMISIMSPMAQVNTSFH